VAGTTAALMLAFGSKAGLLLDAVTRDVIIESDIPVTLIE
jgi:hypothetical protein